VLSRLISLLRRITAVKWAFTRLRPPPHGGSIDVAPIATVGPATIADVVATPAGAIEINAEPLQEDASLVAAAPTKENDTAVSVVLESPSTGICVDASTPERSAKVETLLPAVDEAADSSPDVGREAPAVPDIVRDTSSDIPAKVEPVLVEAAAPSVEIEPAPVDGPDIISERDPSPIVSVADPVVADQIHVLVADADDVAADAPEACSDDDPSPAIEIAPASANDGPFAAAMEVLSADSPGSIAAIEPAPAVVSSAPVIRSARTAQARPAEPTDRAALIRQRWTETGIRMWNPRLHGAGEATLNIQGSVGLLPPAAGETMPRYDKLEFKMLGGQIVCEGVIVEAPAHASQRSFTRLAESAKFERAREPVRERQAALA